LEFDALDNEKYIYNQEAAKLIDILLDFPSQFKNAEKVLEQSDIRLRTDYKNILVIGVGNPSTVAFKLLESVKENKLKIPACLISTKEIPSWVSSDTLIIAISHSGNTIEVLDAVDALTERGFEIIAITTGGRLKEKSDTQDKIKILLYSAELLPRMALGYCYVLLLEILAKANALSVSGFSRNEKDSIGWDDVENELYKFTRELIPEIKIYKNTAKKLAINLFNKIPVIYGCNRLTGAVAYRFKIQLCTVSKVISWYNTLPEINHDEIVGWEMQQDLKERFIVLFITDRDANPDTRKRIELLQGIFLEKNIKYDELELEAANDVVKAFKGIFLADWISLYLAILNNVDPNAITLIDKIKSRLKKME